MGNGDGDEASCACNTFTYFIKVLDAVIYMPT